jgi:hypothetical protein
MTLNDYYHVKDAYSNVSFSQTQWITPNQVINEFVQSNDDAPLYIAKYRNKIGSLTLKSVSICDLKDSSNLDNKMVILKLDKSSYYWSSTISNSKQLIPKYALRAGFDNQTKQFAYIGRNEGRIGSVSLLYECIPSATLKFDDLSSKLIDLNCKYEILCLKSKPQTLKQLASLKLLECEEKIFKLQTKEDQLKQLNRVQSLSRSMRLLIWPYFLLPGQCLNRNGCCIRSMNCLYEVYLNTKGTLTFKYYNNGVSQISYFEKNIETIVVSNYGIFLIYDNKQETRKPKCLYNHSVEVSLVKNDCASSSLPLLWYSARFYEYVFHLSDKGCLQIITKNNKNEKIAHVYDLINLNDYFNNNKCTINNNESIKVKVSTVHDKTSVIDDQILNVHHKNDGTILKRSFLNLCFYYLNVNSKINNYKFKLKFYKGKILNHFNLIWNQMIDKISNQLTIKIQ